MLAPPNDGTWLPMQVLSGDDTFGGLLTTGAPPLGEPKVRDAFGTMPGLLQLQAQLSDEAVRLADVHTWERFAAADTEYERDRQSWHRLDEQHEQMRWGKPSEARSESAAALRRRLDEAARRLAPEHARKMAIVAGIGRATVDGVRADVPRGANWRPQDAVRLRRHHVGDGRIAASRTGSPGVTTYGSEVEHEMLPS